MISERRSLVILQAAIDGDLSICGKLNPEEQKEYDETRAEVLENEANGLDVEYDIPYSYDDDEDDEDADSSEDDENRENCENADEASPADENAAK